MSKRKDKKTKKTACQKFLKKTRKFFVNGKPMSQTVHWTIILSITGILLIKIAQMNQEIARIQEITSRLLNT